MVKQKKALQLFWKDSCSVFIQSKKQNLTTKRNEFDETALFENQPCKLSFETLTSTSETDHAPSISQGVKLFLDSELSVPAGSKVVVVRNGRTFTYKASGEPGVFTNHQEIPLELFESWA